MEKEILINHLIETGWHCEESFLPIEICDDLAGEVKTWKPANIGKGQNQVRLEAIRNDEINWIDPSNASRPLKYFLSQMDDLKNDLNRELFLGLNEFECHFARYKSGGFYKKHLDQHQESKSRILSIIVYLNSPESGGELVIYNKHNCELIDKKVKPRKGLMVCFLSDQIHHEVLPTNEERLSLTGWFRSKNATQVI